jgi:hypothetical protein
MLPSSRDLRRWKKGLSGSVSSHMPSLPSFSRQRSSGISGTTAGISAAGALLLGVGAMWLFDPSRGRGRRAWLMQKANRCINETGQMMNATGRHIRNRMRGYAHEAGSLIHRDRPADDQLAERVRSELGRIGVRGSSVGVRAENGLVFLTGRCVVDDMDRIVGSVRGVHGVRGIENLLQVGNMYGSISTEPSTSPSTGNISA